MRASVHSAASLGVNVAWGAVGAVVYALGQWLLVVVVARAGTPADLGRFSLALALVAPPALLFGLNLRTLVATDASHAHPLEDIFRLRIWASALYLVLVTLLAVFVPTVAALAVALALWKTVDAFSDVCYGAYQRAERLDRIGISQCVKALALAGTFSLGFAATGDLLISTTMLVAASISVLYALDLPSLRGEPSVYARPWFTLVLAALPAGGAAFLDSLVLNVPRYFVHAHHGAAELGFFSSAAYFMVAGGTLVGAIGFSITPRLARLYLADRFGFRWLLFRSLQWSLGIGALGLALAAAFGGTLLELVYGPAYGAYEKTLIVVMLAALLWYGAGIASCALNAARRFSLNLLIMAATLVALAASTLLLVPAGGALGAGWALCIGMAVRFALSLGAALRL